MTTDVIRQILLNDSDVFASIGFTYGTPATKEIRCFRSDFPNGTTIPCLTYHDIGGGYPDPVGRSISFQVTSWTQDEISCKTLADKVETALTGFCGNVGGIFVDGIDPISFVDSYREAATNLWYSYRKFSMLYGVA